MVNPQIEALDIEIQNLEKQIDQNSDMNQITRINEHIYSRKLEQQRLVALDASEVPQDIREQLDSLSREIASLEDRVTKATTGMINSLDRPDVMQKRLTYLKIQKQALLSKLPSIGGMSQ